MVGSERQEKIFRAWAEALCKLVSDLDLETALHHVRTSVADAETAIGTTLKEMDQRELSDPAKAQFVGTVVSNLYRDITRKFPVESAELIRKALIDVYQQFPDHSS